MYFVSFDHSQVSFIIFFTIYLWPYYQTRWSGYTLLTLAFIYIDSHSCRRATLWCRDNFGGGGGGKGVSLLFYVVTLTGTSKAACILKWKFQHNSINIDFPYLIQYRYILFNCNSNSIKIKEVTHWCLFFHEIKFNNFGY